MSARHTFSVFTIVKFSISQLTSERTQTQPRCQVVIPIQSYIGLRATQNHSTEFDRYLDMIPHHEELDTFLNDMYHSKLGVFTHFAVAHMFWSLDPTSSDLMLTWEDGLTAGY